MEEQSIESGLEYRSVRKRWQKSLKLWGRIVARLQRWNELSNQRRQLRELSDDQLKDIGLSRADVVRIAENRWFWDDPVNRKENLDQRYRHDVRDRGC